MRIRKLFNIAIFGEPHTQIWGCNPVCKAESETVSEGLDYSGKYEAPFLLKESMLMFLWFTNVIAYQFC